MTKTTVTIFDNVNSELRRKHLTQNDLAKKLGIDRRTWTTWQDKNDMPIAKLVEIAMWFDCSLNYLTRDVIEK